MSDDMNYELFVCSEGHVHHETEADSWRMEPEEAIEAAGMLRQAAKQAMKAKND